MTVMGHESLVSNSVSWSTSPFLLHNVGVVTWEDSCSRKVNVIGFTLPKHTDFQVQSDGFNVQQSDLKVKKVQLWRLLFLSK